LQDDRFRHNPLVTGKPYFRFYVGVPLQTSDGFNIGTLSLLDQEPRFLNHEQQHQLAGLAILAMELLESRRVSKDVYHEPETERQSVLGKVNDKDFALQVMGSMGQGLVVFKTDYTIEYANLAFAKMGGFLVEELVGKTPFDLILKNLYPRIEELGLPGLPAWDSSYETELRRKDGTFFNALIVLEPIYRDEELDGIVGVITDLSGQKLVEQQLRTALEKEKELGEMKTRLISTASHEFRTPLSAIISSTELLEYYSQRWSEEKKVEILNRISQSAYKLTRLIEDILVYSRAEEGKLNCVRARQDLPTFCQSLVASLQSNATDHKRISMVEIGQRQETYLDEKLLSYILTNLLSSGVKYSEPGGLVTLELEWQSDQITFRVKDAGIGIPLKDQGNLFQPFQRASNVGTISGTGFGLAIVNYSVLAHSGQIYFKSVEEKGSTFTVNLPLRSNSGEVTWLETPTQKGLYREPGQEITSENVTENLWLLQQAIDASSSGILITHATMLDDAIVYASRGFEKLTGFSREEVIGKSGQFLEGAARDQPGLVEIRRAIEEERECQVILRNYRKDGSLFWNELQLSPIRDAAGKVIYLVDIQNDVSDRIKAELALNQSEEKFKALVENSPDIVARLDRNARFLYINPTFETVFGGTLTGEEATTKSLSELGLSDQRLLNYESHLNRVL
jgi:PAS domain S-box-containing protein